MWGLPPRMAWDQQIRRLPRNFVGTVRECEQSESKEKIFSLLPYCSLKSERSPLAGSWSASSFVIDWWCISHCDYCLCLTIHMIATDEREICELLLIAVVYALGIFVQANFNNDES